ncbi:endonuclease domain-containing protein [Novosphingobium sp. MMS21-SN21R]|uniref:endonuclease domain-containing protein n=1 Tax=Novosphingobium sp. MMS21-SN21R TaxID=2969298 RepID=UPI0028858FF5|nr:endonuclease domain-containing protein [Novosphingobium sp. MMS21-SN21R]MDT0508671.1 endonuclease domain-containing protein [Novosphingobium sp. MMS21-SN21R]
MKKAPPPLAIIRARRMRREPTLAEAAMWQLLRAHFSEWRFRRQVPLGHAICDFASHRARLVIEIDGGQHGGADDLARDASDVARDAFDVARDAMIGREGYRVVRFWNNEVLGNIEGVARVLSGVLGEIALQLHSPPSSANSPPSNFG